MFISHVPKTAVSITANGFFAYNNKMVPCPWFHGIVMVHVQKPIVPCMGIMVLYHGIISIKPWSICLNTYSITILPYKITCYYHSTCPKSLGITMVQCLKNNALHTIFKKNKTKNVMSIVPCLKKHGITIVQKNCYYHDTWSKQITIVLGYLFWVFSFPTSLCPALCVVMDVQSHWGLEEPLEEISCLCSVWLPQESQPTQPTQTRAAAPRAQMLSRYCAVNCSHGVTQTSADSHAAIASMNDETLVQTRVSICATG